MERGGERERWGRGRGGEMERGGEKERWGERERWGDGEGGSHHHTTGGATGMAGLPCTCINTCTWHPTSALSTTSFPQDRAMAAHSGMCSQDKATPPPRAGWGKRDQPSTRALSVLG